MAEVIGATSGIVALVSLALSVSHASYEYVQKVRKAPASTSRYLQEFLAFSSTLLRVQETLALPGVASSLSGSNDLVPQPLIAECRQELQTIKRKLEKRGSATSGFSAKLHILTWPFEEKETREIVDRLARYNSIFSSIVNTANLSVNPISTSTITDPSGGYRVLRLLPLKLGSMSRRTLVLDWIYSNPSTINNDDIFGNCCEDTCSWVLSDGHFCHWQGEDGRSLFCTGSPGVGKTTLTSFVINHITTSTTSSRVLYHYFDFRAEQQYHTGVAVVRNLLRQLLEDGEQVPEALASLHERSLKTKTEPTYKAWIDILCKLIGTSPQVYILLDGFDECPDRAGLNRLFRGLKNMTVKSFVAGRGSIDLEVDFHGNRQLEILASEQDLTTYIESILEENEDLDTLLTASLRVEVIAKLVAYADGVFLLAKLALQSLTSCATVRQVKKALLTVPKDLRSAHEATFERIMSSVPAKKELATKTLAWILFAIRPLTMAELLHILAFEPGDNEVDAENLTTPKTVISACLGLIEHREVTGLVQFSHASVKEYLEAEEFDIFEVYLLEIARSCVNYLDQPAFRARPCDSLAEMLDRLEKYPLLRYAALHWGTHAIDFQKELAAEVSKLVRTANAVSNAAQIFHYLRRAKSHVPEATFSALPQGFQKLHLLALWGLKDIAILDNPTYVEIMMPDSLGWTPLHWASARGHADMVRLLLSRGADIEARDLRQWTPLFWAVYWCRAEALRCLLDEGAIPQAKDSDGNTPLHIAVSRGHSEICHELLTRGVDVTVESLRGSSSFDEALRSQVPEIAAMFLDIVKPGEMETREDAFVKETALERAVAWDPAAQNSVFRLTLEGETTAAESSDWPRPLLRRLEQYEKNLLEKDPARLTSIGSHLIQFGYSGMPKDLINQDAYVAGVLGYAVLTERIEMVKALIDIGVELNTPWQRRWTRIYEEQFPVLLASFVGNAKLIELLVSHGASVNVSDYKGRTPLHYAAMLGHFEAATVLCVHKQLLESRDERGKTPMHVVWSKLIRAHESRDDRDSSRRVTVKAKDVETSLAFADLLVQNECDVNMPDHLGNTPVHDAVRTGSLEAVQKLVQLGADINIRANKESDYWQGGLDPRRKVEGAEPALDFQGDTPFTLACTNYELEVASALHHAGGILPENLDLRQPLIRAVADGDCDAVHTLFSFGSASHVAGFNADAIPLLIVAIRSLQWVMDTESQRQTNFRRSFTKPQRHIDTSDGPKQYHTVIKFLLSVEQDPNAADPSGNTALLEALEYEYNADIVDTLLSSGADPHLGHKNGMTALHVAAATGYAPFVRLLLSHKVRSNCAANDSSTPISQAAVNGHQDVVLLLLEHTSFEASTQGRHDWVRLSQCHNAIRSRDSELFRDIFASPLPLSFVDRKGQTLLHMAAATGIDDIVSRLLSLGADVKAQDLRGDYPLHIAAASRTPSVAVIKLLVDAGADIKAENYYGDDYGIYRIPQDATPLHSAAYVGNVAIIEALLEVAGKTPQRAATSIQPTSASPSPTGTPSLTWQHWQQERTLLREQYINFGSNGCGRTALMCAVESGHVAAAKILLEHGASVNLSGGGGSWGFNALDLALPSDRSHDQADTAEGEKSKMVKLLESYGAEVFDW